MNHRWAAVLILVAACAPASSSTRTGTYVPFGQILTDLAEAKPVPPRQCELLVGTLGPGPGREALISCALDDPHGAQRWARIAIGEADG